MDKKMKNMDIINALNGIEQLKRREEKRGEAILSPEVSFLVLKNKKTLLATYEAYDEARKAIVGSPKEGDALTEEQVAKLTALLGTECEMAIDTISMDNLAACNGILIQELEALDFMIR